MPKISVIMSVYNTEKYLTLAVESILNQSEKDFEFIIVNDGSTDTSLSILQEFEKKDKRVVLISRKENLGLISSLNEGVSHASGTYVARMDADDMSEKTRLEEQLRYMEKTDVVLCGLWAKGIDEKGNVLYPLHYPPEKDKDILAMLVKHNPFIHPSVMFKKESFVSVGGYHSFFKYVEDYELWTRMIAKGSLGNIGKELIFYRLHDEQITKKKKTKMIIMGILVRMLAVIRIFRR